MGKESSAAAGTKRESLWQSICKHKGLYLMAVPGFIWFVLFKYIPLAGSVIAFMDYDIYKGINGSKFAGFKHFAHFFKFPEFGQIFRNTAILGTYDVLIVFPIPIILAILMNEVRSAKYKKAVQTAVYVPHFLSWVIIGGIFTTLLSPNTGVINNFRQMLGLDSIYYMASEKHIYKGGRNTGAGQTGGKEERVNRQGRGEEHPCSGRENSGSRAEGEGIQRYAVAFRYFV